MLKGDVKLQLTNCREIKDSLLTGYMSYVFIVIKDDYDKLTLAACLFNWFSLLKVLPQIRTVEDIWTRTAEFLCFCYQKVSAKSRVFGLSVHCICSFVRTDLVTTISHEWLEQFH